MTRYMLPPSINAVKAAKLEKILVSYISRKMKLNRVKYKIMASTIITEAMTVLASLVTCTKP